MWRKGVFLEGEECHLPKEQGPAPPPKMGMCIPRPILFDLEGLNSIL